MFPNESINPISVSRQQGYEAGWLEAGRLEAGWLEVMGALASLVLHWGGFESPDLSGTALGRLWEPWLHCYCTGEAVGALTFLVLHWGGCGSPDFAGTDLASLVLHWGLWDPVSKLLGVCDQITNESEVPSIANTYVSLFQYCSTFLGLNLCFQSSKYCFTSL